MVTVQIETAEVSSPTGLLDSFTIELSLNRRSGVFMRSSASLMAELLTAVSGDEPTSRSPVRCWLLPRRFRFNLWLTSLDGGFYES